MTTLPAGEFILIAVSNCLSSALGSFANLTVILAYLLYTSQRETTDLLLVSLSIADFLLCSVHQPVFIHQLLSAGPNIKRAKLVQTVLGYGLMTASLNGLLAVTADRFVAVYFPYKYPEWMTQENTKRFIAVGWILALITGIFSAMPFSSIILICRMYMSILILLLPLMYSFIWKETRKQGMRVRVLQRAPEPIPLAEDDAEPYYKAFFIPPPPAPLVSRPQESDLVQLPANAVSGRPEEEGRNPADPCAANCEKNIVGSPEGEDQSPADLCPANRGQSLARPSVEEDRSPADLCNTRGKCLAWPEPRLVGKGPTRPEESSEGAPVEVSILPDPAEAVTPGTRQKFGMDRATKLVGLVLGTTMACWLPLVFCPLIWPTRETDRGIAWCITAASFNSCLNPFMYCWMSQKFRNVFRKAFTRAGVTNNH